MCLRDSARSTWKQEHYEMGKLITHMLALTQMCQTTVLASTAANNGDDLYDICLASRVAREDAPEETRGSVRIE